MSVEDNWQTTRPSIKERTKFMLNNVLFSDVKFVVRKSDGESESKEVISAHKFVLSIGSPVFEAMFYGELVEIRESIELPDCDFESLLELFRYMYSDEVKLSGSNVMRVLYLAKKYMVPSLVEKCTEYLQNNLDPTNVFKILPVAEKYEEKNLVDRCWKVIDEQTEAAVKSDGFATIESSLLEAVVVRDTLTIKEVDLFQAVDLWATKQCEKQGAAVNGKLKRRILGEEIIKAIRFPVMKQEEFAGVVLNQGILTKGELVTLFQFFSSTLTTAVGFSKIRRSGICVDIYSCGRFTSVSMCEPTGNDGSVVFSVDKDITLHGLSLFGGEICRADRVKLVVKNISNSAVLSKTGTFATKRLQYEDSYYYGYKVLFDFGVNLKKNAKYEIEAHIHGSRSWRGVGGFKTVLRSGVTFTFSNSDSQNSNGTNENEGQFPEFLFSLS